ncbi:hypothetical protein GCU60_17770 [Blastococcus saxobsidens]|uniref:Uncharacterized protein n=1 Tax=Blastococcus saxobsidens TaxID=138336 RepID=A0A6L9W0C2_9ACTN|nr:hypothetical protein [Blastococcus saxobsidens]NEK85398.1 hypothetical protein [Blastococcus saxobsidens]NEK87590.1 hypothetical protein [Blastococcus saxobsidens]
MAALIQLVALLAAFAGVIVGFGPLTRWLELRAARRSAARGPAPSGRPLERVAADLRRLGRQVDLVPAGAPMARRRGLLAAYDDVLLEAAGMLGVPTSLTSCPEGRAREVERLRLVAELRGAGLRVPV